MATLLNTRDFSSIALSAITGPTITNVQVTNSSYVPQTATALSTLTGGYITVTGTNFTSTTNIYLDYGTLVSATSVTYVSATTLHVQMPPMAAGNYIMILVTSTGSIAIRINAVAYAQTPIWISSPAIAGYNGVQLNINLSSSIGYLDTVIYSVAQGSSLPNGLTLTSTGLLSGTITGLTNNTTYNVTLVATDSENQAVPQTFTIVISTQIDTYFNQSLLINGSYLQTPYLLDSSINNNQISPVGQARSDIFNPYYGNGYYSVVFNGLTDYLYGSLNSSAFIEGQGSYTLEGYFNLNAQGGGTIPTTLGILNACLSTVSTSAYHAWGFYSSTQIAISTNNSLTYNYVTLSQSLPLFTWFHLAIVFNGTTNTGVIYYNGVQVGAWADATAYTANLNGIYMVGSMYGSTGLFKGYISSLRFVKSVAVYTSSFTPSFTIPLINYTNYTALLLCQNSSFTDNSINSSTNTITPVGVTKVSIYIPYTASSSYSTYGSGYLNGSTDYWTVPSTTNLQMLGSDFTIETNIYLTALPSTNSYYVICSKGSVANSNFEYQYSIYNNLGSYKFDLQITTNGTTVLEYQSNTTLLYINQWYNVSVSKVLNTVYFWINGTSLGQFSSTSSTLFAGSANLIIGALVGTSASYFYTGYLSNFRLTKGTGLYYLPYTPSTTQITIVANTQLLSLQFNGPVLNNGIIDLGPFNNIITRNGYVTQGSFTPFSQNGWSYYLDGTTGSIGVVISYQGSSNFNLSNVSFTIEAYIWVQTLSTNQYIVNLASSLVSPSGLVFGINSSGYPIIGNGAGTINAGSIAVSVNSWNHIAVVSNGTTCTLYTNGVANATTYNFNPNSASYVYIGKDAAGSNYFNGYVSNIRIVSGTQVYTGNFTPSTVPLTFLSNTILLTAQSNRYVDNSLTSVPLISIGNASVQAFSPFIDNTNIPNSFSGYFPGGTSTYITTSGTQIIPGSYPYTIESWINISTYASNPVIVSQGTAGNAGRTSFFVNSSGYLSYGIGGTVVTSTGTVPLNTWTYVAVVATSSTSVTFYIGNFSSGTVGLTGTPQNSALVVGGDWQGSPSITGYMSNLRISNIARSIYYAPLTYFISDLNTTLLMFVNNSGISDLSPASNALTIAGTVNLYTVNPFGNTLTQPVTYSTSAIGGSLYFNGITDYLTIPASINNFFGIGTFTVEFWLYPTTLPTTGTTYSLVDFWCNTTGSYLNGTSNTQWTTVLYSSGAVEFIYATGVNSATTITSANTININTWSHIAFVRNSAGTLNIYINGVQDSASGALGNVYLGYSNYTGSIGVETNTKVSTSYYAGYLSNVRINNFAVYTTPFSPPIAPLIGTTVGTLLLLNAIHAGIFDASGRINFVTNNSFSSSAVYKFGNDSMYYSGNAYLLASYNPFFNFGTGNFTIEFWINSSSIASGQQVIGQYSSSYSTWSIKFTSTGVLGYYVSSNGLSWNIANGLTIGSVTVGSWYHVALVRNGSTFTPYINGVAGTTSTSSAAVYNTTAPLTIGATYNSGSSIFDGQLISTFSNYFNGYIDDLRLTKGIARYTTTFTPPVIGDFPQ
jgi:hypothetical protein